MKSSLKLLHVIHGLTIGGAEKDLITKSIVLSKNDSCDISICCLLRTGELVDSASAQGIKIIGPLMSFRYDLFAGILLRKIITQGEWDIVHSHLFAANLITSLVYKTIPKTHRTPHVLSEHSMATRWGKTKLLLDKWMVNSADKFLYPSAATLDSYRLMGVEQAKLVVVPNSIDISIFSPENQSINRKHVRKELGLSIDENVLITVSRLEPVKNLNLIVDALRDINAVWIVVGDGSERSTLECQAKQLGVEKKVIFLGKRSDVPRLLSAADIFVLPSRSETFAISIGEAILMGLPVIATNVGGIPEITNGYSFAKLIEPGNKDQLIGAIHHVFHNIDLYKEKALNGSAYIRQRFSPEETSRKQYEVYQSLLPNR